MRQVKMIRRCFPIKQNYWFLWWTPERQNFNASQTQPGKSIYSRTNCMGSSGQPTRSSGHTCTYVCSHQASQTPLRHIPYPSSTLKRWGSWALHRDSPRLKSSSSKLPLSWWEISLQLLGAAGSHGQPDPCPSAEAGLFGHNTSPLVSSRLLSDNPHCARIPRLEHWTVLGRFVTGGQMDGRNHPLPTCLLLQATQHQPAEAGKN